MSTQWNLRAVLVPPAAISRLEAVGAARLAGDAVLDALQATIAVTLEYIEDTDACGLLVEVPAVGTALTGAAARAQVYLDRLRLETPGLEGWRTEVTGVADDLSPDADVAASSSNEGALNDALALEQSQQEFQDSIFAAAELFNALPLEELTGDLHGLDPDGRATALREATFLAGCLIHASITTLDELFDDAAELGDDAWEDGTQPRWGLRVISQLPERFAANYTAGFARRFTVAYADMTRRLTEGWTPLACVAQELGLRILLDETQAVAELAEVDLPSDWRGMLEDLLFEDVDHEFLYPRSLDGFEDDPDIGPPGMADMKFEAWFRPFNPSRHLPPFVID